MKWIRNRYELKVINENAEFKNHHIPTYEECVEMCSSEEPSFYESKMVVDGYNVSVFNYRFAMYKDFVTPIPDKPEVKAYEMRGLTFVFNKDGSLYNRYILLEKFFNLNQVPESMYSIVKDYKIKYVNNKEDGSIASFIRLPNGKAYGKSKMGFDNDQANGINRIYKTNPSIKKLVDWALDNDIVAIFEYVAPHNRIVLRYAKEELILLRLRDNKTGLHIDIKEHLDKIGDIKIAPFEDDHTLDGLIEKSLSEIDREGWIVQFQNGHLVKVKTAWYCERHGLLTEDLYREHIIIGYILDDKIDDILGQIPEEEVEAHERINKIISIVKQAIADKVADIQKSYQVFVAMGENRKDYALKYIKIDPNFGYVMSMSKGGDIYELAKDWVRRYTDRLMIARDWLKKKDATLFFQDPEDNEDDN
jgi:T4 RnlA family RNA ligase